MVVLGASSPLASWSPVLTDAAFLVVDKDAGLLTVPGNTRPVSPHAPLDLHKSPRRCPRTG